MTVTQLLDLPTPEKARLSDSELEALMGDLIPAARQPDKENLVVQDSKRLLSQGEAIMAAIMAKKK